MTKVGEGELLDTDCTLKNWDRLRTAVTAEQDQRSIRSALQATICAVDADIGFSQERGYTRDLAGPMRDPERSVRALVQLAIRGSL